MANQVTTNLICRLYSFQFVSYFLLYSALARASSQIVPFLFSSALLIGFYDDRQQIFCCPLVARNVIRKIIGSPKLILKMCPIIPEHLYSTIYIRLGCFSSCFVMFLLIVHRMCPVSYTHLTLPTILRV